MPVKQLKFEILFNIKREKFSTVNVSKNSIDLFVKYYAELISCEPSRM